MAWWDDLLAAFETCMAATGCEGSPRMYWGAHQAFFKQLLNSLKTRFAIEEARAAIDRGECVVIGLLSTGEARAAEAVERLGHDLEGEISTPHEIARDMLLRHLPTRHAETDQPVEAAITLRDELLTKLEAIRMPGNALDLLITAFGESRVAEMTGRKMRLLSTGDGRSEWVSRAPPGVSHEQLNLNEKNAFLSGEKPVRSPHAPPTHAHRPRWRALAIRPQTPPRLGGTSGGCDLRGGFVGDLAPRRFAFRQHAATVTHHARARLVC